MDYEKAINVFLNDCCVLSRGMMAMRQKSLGAPNGEEGFDEIVI